MQPIRYAIVARHAAAHLFDVTLRVDDPDPRGQAFYLPAWIPGSYMIREFARNIVTLTAHDAAGGPVPVRKTGKDRWLADPVDGALTLRYQVYAWDLSVRSAHLDQTVGFFNGTSVFLAVAGREAASCLVDIQRPEGAGFASWRVATALPEADGTARYGFGLYRAADYDELIDHPVTLGEFALATFDACGVPHDVVISGPVPGLDMDRLTADLRKICETQIAFFEPDTQRAPMDRYVFMTMAVTDGYGGLEHRASTALIAKRGDFPVRGAAGDGPLSDGYRTYLGLCSHEYFHTWNVKRIKPDRFAPYDLTRETPTELLWLFEGFTSYYDDLFLLRSGVIPRTDYLRLLGKTVGGVLRGSGRRKQSVAESSFDAWVKYYRQDENATNAIVSYYTKGSLVALAFDLAIRAASDGQRSLDDVMRALWHRYGRDFYAGKPVGIAADAVLPLLCEASGTDLGELFALAVQGTDDLPLERLLAAVGVTLAPVPGKQPVSIGARVKAGADATLAAVFDDGAAQHAGLSAGDILVALDGLRITGGNLDGLLARYRPGQMVVLHAFRRDVLRDFTLSLDVPDVVEYALAVREAGGAEGRDEVLAQAGRLREAWLGAS
ncbi:PDZ domain-containing protein [Robbsia sp. Bb-Pol-6]|uniref:PDZ domain-containing protein n=1 Tax=Robbsia betulipollinis TaxID=2981849 RepID=A0ABT3ZNY2_9BURK|nr:PDZ domain-containing protein [Robbsia betulipollinis]MCY0388251.1 PDZ domain-containing protein [Robbsia betulipollinis]